MITLQDYLETIQNEQEFIRMNEILMWIDSTYPELTFKYAWNQPMFTHHDTFIIGFSMAKQHLAIAPEVKGIQTFIEQIHASRYSSGSNIFRIKWSEPIDYELLDKIILFNIQDKQLCTTFWRK